MSRRAVHGEQEFGSDSFLDIIANIVGILIILIVVAGLRVAHQPPESSAPAEEVAAADVLTPDTSDDEPVLSEGPPEFPVVLPEEEPDHEAELQLATLLDEIADVEVELQDLTEQIKSLERQLEERNRTRNMLMVKNSDLEEEREALTDRLDELKRKLSEIASTGTEINETLASLSDRKLAVMQRLDSISEQTRSLREILENVETVAEPTDQLKHRILPVSRSTSQTPPIHFRLEGGRVAVVPLERLVDRAHSQLRRRMATLRKLGRMTVQAGPENGFTMEYQARLVSIRGMTGLGGMAVRPAHQFEVRPSLSVRSETVDQAVEPGSRFRQILEAAEPGTVVTIWVYDSDRDFEHYAKLRDFAYRMRHEVAAWPLENGKHISGSSSGYRPSSQ